MRRNYMSEDDKEGLFKKLSDALSEKDRLAARKAAKEDDATAEARVKNLKRCVRRRSSGLRSNQKSGGGNVLKKRRTGS